jgi:hypothetical protein
MSTIHKYTLQQHGAAIVPMPKGAQMLHVGNQCDALQLWALVDAEQPLEARRIRVAFTGEAMETDHRRTYLGTWISSGGNLVAHVFEESARQEKTDAN